MGEIDYLSATFIALIIISIIMLIIYFFFGRSKPPIGHL